MKKIRILLIALMVISVGFVDSCIASSEPCGTCNGTGKCNRCNGSGWEIWQIDRCDKCDGSGDCQTCDGSGYIESGAVGFELILVILAIGLVIFWKRKTSKQ